MGGTPAVRGPHWRAHDAAHRVWGVVLQACCGALLSNCTDMHCSMALVWDRALKPHVEKYARDSEAFFEDFASAFSRLLELGKRWHAA